METKYLCLVFSNFKKNKSLNKYVQFLFMVWPCFQIQFWFSYFLAVTHKIITDICPGPKQVKITDLQAHNVA